MIHLKSLQTLPNKNQVFFPDKQYHEPRYPSGHALHPAFDPGTHDTQSDLTVTVYDDTDVDKLIRRGTKQGLITQEECDILVGTGETPPAHIVERSDLCRFLLLYLEGRFCVDTDRIVSLPMSMGPAIYNPHVMQRVFAVLSDKDMGAVDNSYEKAREALNKYG
ncbi:hypothetical protein ACHAWX_000220 [Stephanocyclus meneghinianus]